MSLEDAVSWAEAIANDDSHGYSQSGREGQDFDCSSLVCRALRAGGLSAPSPSFSTRSMGAWLTTHGWVWHEGTLGVARGDVLWKVGHTAFAVSGTRTVEALIDERGRITGGKTGDQTGNEITFRNIASTAWVGYWRYMGATSDDPDHKGGFGGTYKCVVDSVNVRMNPSTSAYVVAKYTKGETVKLDDWYVVADGYVWGRYVGGSGNIRYVAVGPYTGGVSDKDFFVRL